MASGAPAAFIEGLPTPWSISISHSAGRAVVAVGDEGLHLGCDLESIESRSETFERDYLTEGELGLLSGRKGAERARWVTLLWCLKESALKALAEGLRLDTRAVEVTRLDEPSPLEGWALARLRRTEDTSGFLAWWRLEGEQVLAIVSGESDGPSQPLAPQRIG
jgi:phosphopantetheinyl transferase